MQVVTGTSALISELTHKRIAKSATDVAKYLQSDTRSISLNFFLYETFGSESFLRVSYFLSVYFEELYSPFTSSFYSLYKINIKGG